MKKVWFNSLLFHSETCDFLQVCSIALFLGWSQFHVANDTDSGTRLLGFKSLSPSLLAV